MELTGVGASELASRGFSTKGELFRSRELAFASASAMLTTTANTTTLRQRMMEDLQIRNFAPTSVNAYIRGVADFAKRSGESADQLGAEQIREYQLFLVKEKGVALPTYIQIVSALRFLYTHTVPVQREME
jgi:hypothetical protein